MLGVADRGGDDLRGHAAGAEALDDLGDDLAGVDRDVVEAAHEAGDVGRAGARGEQRLVRREDERHVHRDAVGGQRVRRLEALLAERDLDDDVLVELAQRAALGDHARRGPRRRPRPRPGRRRGRRCAGRCRPGRRPPSPAARDSWSRRRGRPTARSPRPRRRYPVSMNSLNSSSIAWHPRSAYASGRQAPARIDRPRAAGFRRRQRLGLRSRLAFCVPAELGAERLGDRHAPTRRSAAAAPRASRAASGATGRRRPSGPARAARRARPRPGGRAWPSTIGSRELGAPRPPSAARCARSGRSGSARSSR